MVVEGAGEQVSPVYFNSALSQPDQAPRQIPLTPPINSDWKIISFGYHPERQPNREVLNSLAYVMGFRASIERHRQGGVHQPAFYRAGLFEKSLEVALENQPSQVADLVCLPDFLTVDFYNSDDRFDIDLTHKQGRLLAYKTILNMRDGTLTYNYLWADKDDRRTEVSITQLVSRADPNIVAIKYSFTPQNYSGKVTLETGINAAVDNKGVNYLAEVERGQLEKDQGVYCAVGTVPSRNHLVAITSRVQLLADGVRINPKSKVTEGPEQINQRVSIEVKPGHTYTLEKTVAVATSKDDWKDPIQASQAILLAAPGFKDLYRDHAAVWEEIWKQSEIEIKGDDEILQALKFNIFKLAQLGQSIDSKANIGAKGLDNMPGEGYLGHAFWDTEIFMLPYFIHNNPEVAKNLLMYRYHNLPAAQAKARSLGYEGALYSWESGDNGEEETPERIVGADGQIIEILTGRHEFHISADIALGVWQYYLATGDEEFMRDYGAEIVAETARFWASKATADSKDADDGKFHIKGVVGPDEYHEGRNQYYLDGDGQIQVRKLPGVNDNFYNNSMAASNLLMALELRKKYAADPTILDKIGISDEEEVLWRDIAENMSMLFDPQTKIIEQFAGYHNLKTADLDNPKYLKNGNKRHDMDNAHKENGEDPWDYQTIKQADVIQALLNLGSWLSKLKAFKDEDIEEIFRANRDYYEKRTSHGSSLSDSMHVVAATRAGVENHAHEHLLDALFIDLNDKKGNNGIGTHTAALGGGWQAIVYGFGGVRLEDDRLSLNPKLIENWQGLKFSVSFKGQQLLVQVRPDSVEVTAAPNKLKRAVVLEVYGQKYTLKSGEVLQVETSPKELDLTA